MNSTEHYTCDLYLLRHGETDYNKRQLTQGNIEVPLNALGRQQAVEAKAALDAMGMKFDYCFSSPLGRAKETGEIVSDIPENDSRFIVFPDLHEMAFGEFEGKPFLEDPMMLTLNQHPEAYRPSKGGETIEEVFDRMNRVMTDMARTAEKLTEQQNDQSAAASGERAESLDGDAKTKEREPLRILVASHGMVMRGILGVIRHTGAADVWKVIIGNCDVLHLRITDGIYEELPKTLAHEDPYDPHVNLDTIGSSS